MLANFYMNAVSLTLSFLIAVVDNECVGGLVCPRLLVSRLTFYALLPYLRGFGLGLYALMYAARRGRKVDNQRDGGMGSTAFLGLFLLLLRRVTKSGSHY